MEESKVIAPPNLFKYATSELSQDAFLCWVLEWLKHRDDRMWPISQYLADCLLKACGETVDWNGFLNVDIPQRQVTGHKTRVDIIVVLHFADGPKVLVVEDKIGADLAPDQMSRNHQTALRQFSEKDVHSVLFRTEYDFDFIHRGFGSVTFRDLDGWVKFCRQKEYAGREILRDWVENYEPKLQRIGELASSAARDALPAKDDKDWAALQFQYLLVKKLFGLDGQPIEYDQEGQDKINYFSSNRYIKRGTSYGKDWIQYWFVRDASRDTGFFYRIDGSPRLSLTFYKREKTEDDKRVADSLAAEFKKIAGDSLRFENYSPSMSDYETKLLIWDLCGSRDLGAMKTIHSKFVGQCWEMLASYDASQLPPI